MISVHGHGPIALVVTGPSSVGTVDWNLVVVWPQAVAVGVVICEQAPLHVHVCMSMSIIGMWSESMQLHCTMIVIVLIFITFSQGLIYGNYHRLGMFADKNYVYWEMFAIKQFDGNSYTQYYTLCLLHTV